MSLNLRTIFLQTDGQPCPSCMHSFVQKLHSEDELEAVHAKREEEYKEKLTVFKSKPKGIQKSSHIPRRARAFVQELMCPCYLLSGINCPSCNGRSKEKQDPNGRHGDMISSCHVCQCTCSVGPFKDKDRQTLAAGARDKERGVGQKKPPTVSDSTGTFGSMINLCLQVRPLKYIILILLCFK